MIHTTHAPPIRAHIRHTAIAVLLATCAITSAFAAGQREEQPPEIIPELSFQSGAIVVDIPTQGDRWSVEVFHDNALMVFPSGVAQLSLEQLNEFTQTTEMPDHAAFDWTLYAKGISEATAANIQVQKATVPSGSVTRAQTLNRQDQVRVSVPLSVEKDTFIRVAADGRDAILLYLPHDTQFFPGEAELVSQLSGLSLHDAAEALVLGMLWHYITEDQLSFHYTDSDLMAEANAVADAGHYQALRDAISHHIEVVTGGCVALGPYAAGVLYGDHASPYIKAYLQALYDSGHPPLTNALNALPRDVAPVYDFRQITAEEGARIAEAALRYLSWGVEYVGHPQTGYAMYASNQLTADFQDSITAWIAGEGESLWRDYLPQQPASISVGRITGSDSGSTIETGGVFSPNRLATQFGLHTESSANVAHIDLWSAGAYGWNLPEAAEGIIRQSGAGFAANEEAVNRNYAVGTTALRNSNQLSTAGIL